MTEGKAYLIHCGDWHTFVGRFEKQVSPTLYGFRSVSKVDNTNAGDNWHELLEPGYAREAASYIHYPDVDGELYELPISIIAMPWKGETPCEAGL